MRSRNSARRTPNTVLTNKSVVLKVKPLKGSVVGQSDVAGAYGPGDHCTHGRVYSHAYREGQHGPGLCDPNAGYGAERDEAGQEDVP